MRPSEASTQNVTESDTETPSPPPFLRHLWSQVFTNPDAYETTTIDLNLGEKSNFDTY